MPERFHFRDLKDLFAKANEQKSGDQLAGIGSTSERERVAAKMKLAELPLVDILRRPLVDPDDDDVSRLILESHDDAAFAPVRSMTVGEFREYVLDDATGEQQLKQVSKGVTPEMAAAVAKLMSNKDLTVAAAKIRNVTHCRSNSGTGRCLFRKRLHHAGPVQACSGRGGSILQDFGDRCCKKGCLPRIAGPIRTEPECSVFPDRQGERDARKLFPVPFAPLIKLTPRLKRISASAKLFMLRSRTDSISIAAHLQQARERKLRVKVARVFLQFHCIRSKLSRLLRFHAGLAQQVEQQGPERT
jgi:hypothetical protein